MSSGTVSDSDPGSVSDDGSEVIAVLREAGGHPLVYSFPLGAIFAFDADLRYLSAGGHGLADVGLSREMLEGKTIFQVFPPETAATIEPLYSAALDGTSTAWDVPYEGRIYLQRLAPVLDAGGRIVGGLGFTQDVTDARAAESALRESEERTRLTFKHAPIGQAIVELDGRWREVNAALTHLTGYTEEQLLGMTFQDITHPDDLDLDLGYVERLLSGEISSYQMEKRYLTASGRTVWVLLSGALVRDDDGSPLYFVSQIQDITETKHEHQALRDVTAMLAHDLRNPAASILGLAEILDEHLSSDPEAVGDYPSRIAAAARAMADLLDNALVTTALDSGLLVSSPQVVSVRELLSFAMQIVDLGSTSIDTSAVEDVEAWVDPVHLNQVITNLLTNAAKYGGDEVTVSAIADQSRVRIVIVIADNGPGVEPDFVPHMFDRFSRSDATRQGSQRGSGLGLYIVRDLLTANDATISYTTSSWGGAEFTIELCVPPPSTDAYAE